MTYDQFDLFDQYTNKTLPDAERQALEDQLRDDPALRDSLRDYQQFRHSLDAVPLNRQLNRIHDRLAAQGFFDTNTSDRPPVPLSSSFRRRRLVLVSSVVVLAGILIGAGYWLTRPTLAEQTFLTFYRPEPVARGGADCGTALLPGIQLYRTQQYEPALQQFTALSASQPCVSYYVGLTQLATDQPEQAVYSLESALKPAITSPPLIRQKAEWYLAMAYLKANQPAEAKSQLIRIAQQPDQPFRNVAQQALADLSHD